MYEVIVNGQDEGDLEQAAKDVDFSLEDERWWQEIKRLRQPNSMSASQELAQAADLLEAVHQWPTASFQHGRRDMRPKRFAALQKMLRRAKSRASVSDIRETGAKVDMRTHQLSADLLLDDASNSDTSISDGDEADDEAAFTESEAGVSGSNFDEYDLDASEDESNFSDANRSRSLGRSKTTPAGVGIPFFSKKLDLRKAIWKGSPKDSSPRNHRPTGDSITPLRPHPGAATSDTAILHARHRHRKARSTTSSTSQLSTSQISTSSRAPVIRDPESLPKFSSKPVPRTAIAQEEAPGPSIMFVDTPAATRHQDPLATAQLPPDSPTPSASHFTSSVQHSPAPSPSPATPQTHATASPASGVPSTGLASGFPAQQSIPLSFNDLPCRAQHLILNELIKGQSEDTAVVFTTLPSPMEGTCKSEQESVKYVSDLEVLTEGLGPVLLVSGGSMTVTMNL
jgi:potassium/chloride transporter 9